jgi:hypothetical protein
VCSSAHQYSNPIQDRRSVILARMEDDLSIKLELEAVKMLLQKIFILHVSLCVCVCVCVCLLYSMYQSRSKFNGVVNFILFN